MKAAIEELLEDVTNLKRLIDTALEVIMEGNLGGHDTQDELTLDELSCVVAKIQLRIDGSYEKCGNDGIRARLNRQFREGGF